MQTNECTRCAPECVRVAAVLEQKIINIYFSCWTRTNYICQLMWAVWHELNSRCGVTLVFLIGHSHLIAIMTYGNKLVDFHFFILFLLFQSIYHCSVIQSINVTNSTCTAHASRNWKKCCINHINILCTRDFDGLHKSIDLPFHWQKSRNLIFFSNFTDFQAMYLLLSEVQPIQNGSNRLHPAN